MQLRPPYHLIPHQYWVLFVVSCLLVSCGESVPQNPDEYLAMINDPVSGMVQEKTVNDVDLRVAYMPATFLAWRDVEHGSESYDEALDHYRSGMNFVLHIDTEQSGQDIMGKNLAGFDEYNERVMLLNFEIKNYVRLETADTVLYPVLGTMENTYGLMTGRKLIVVFAASPEILLKNHDHFDIVFDDPVFGTGINRFHYTTSTILHAPTPQI